RYEPTPAGDRFFAVPGADPGGNVSLRAGLVGDYAHHPLVLATKNGDEQVGIIVGDQLFVHAGLSLSLWDRLVLSVNQPFALLVSGDSPSFDTFSVNSPKGAAVGDLRGGVRLRLLGEARGPVQLAVGGSVWFPTGNRERYAGDGRLRGRPELTLSG